MPGRHALGLGRIRRRDNVKISRVALYTEPLEKFSQSRSQNLGIAVERVLCSGSNMRDYLDFILAVRKINIIA